MTDDNNKNSSENKPHDFEEEFDFDANDIFEASDSNIKNDMNNTFTPVSNKNKFTLPIIMGIVVAGFIIYKIYGVLFPPSADTRLDKIAAEESAAIQATQSISTQKSLPVREPTIPVPTQNVPTPAATPLTPSQEHVMPTPVVPPSLSVMQAPIAMDANTHTLEEIKHLENTVNQVMDSLNKMDQKLNLIGKEFFAVSDNVAKLSQEMAQMKAKKSTAQSITHKAPHTAAKRHHHKKVTPIYHIDQDSEKQSQPNINLDLDETPEQTTKHHVKKTTRPHKAELTIHAIIPGRVWLRAPDGSTITVAPGETIPGYGKAMVIDAPSSTVVTSSGVVLR